MDDLFLCPKCGSFHQPETDRNWPRQREAEEDWEGFIAKVNSRLTVKEFFYKRCNKRDSCEKIRSHALKDYAEFKRRLGRGTSSKLPEVVPPKVEIVDEPTADSNAFVYLIEGNSHYKIGIAANVPKRKATLQTSSPFDLKVVKFWESASPHKAERYWHIRFKSYRMKGEWFRLPSEEVEALLQVANLDEILPHPDHVGSFTNAPSESPV